MGKKARKPITTKEPPVPTDSHAEIEDWMIRLVMPEMHPIVERQIHRKLLRHRQLRHNADQCIAVVAADG